MIGICNRYADGKLPLILQPLIFKTMTSAIKTAVSTETSSGLSSGNSGNALERCGQGSTEARNAAMRHPAAGMNGLSYVRTNVTNF